MEKPKINFNEFLEIANKLEIRTGMIVAAKRIPKKDKLLELRVAFGHSADDNVSCVTNLGEIHEPEDFIGNKLPFIMNLEPAKMGGVVSEVMLMVNDLDGGLDIELDKFKVGGKLM